MSILKVCFLLLFLWPSFSIFHSFNATCTGAIVIYRLAAVAALVLAITIGLRDSLSSRAIFSAHELKIIERKVVDKRCIWRRRRRRRRRRRHCMQRHVSIVDKKEERLERDALCPKQWTKLPSSHNFLMTMHFLHSTFRIKRPHYSWMSVKYFWLPKTASIYNLDLLLLLHQMYFNSWQLAKSANLVSKNQAWDWFLRK